MMLSEFRTQTRYYLADPNNKRWGVPEVDSYINMALGFYYNKLVNLAYEGIATTPVDLNTVAGTNTIALPSDFHQGKILYKYYPSVKTGATKKIPCKFKQNYEQTQLLSGLTGTYKPSYSFVGRSLLLDPVPWETLTAAFELHYWPVMTNLVNATDEPVAGFSKQWHQMIPIKAAYIAKSLREEEDTTNIERLLAVEEQPFNDMLDVMTIARRQIEPFDSSGYLNSY
jgi:hypothetical protein